MDTPPTGFSVLARVGDAILGGSATMTIGPGRVELTPGFSLSRATGVTKIIQTSDEVEVYRPRLSMPWTNRTILIRDGEHVGTASVWITKRRRLKRALTGSGLGVVEHRTWTDRGDQHVRGGRAGLYSDEGAGPGGGR